MTLTEQMQKYAGLLTEEDSGLKDYYVALGWNSYGGGTDNKGRYILAITTSEDKAEKEANDFIQSAPNSRDAKVQHFKAYNEKETRRKLAQRYDLANRFETGGRYDNKAFEVKTTYKLYYIDTRENYEEVIDHNSNNKIKNPKEFIRRHIKEIDKQLNGRKAGMVKFKKEELSES